jgi:hypothetical protein
MMKPRMIPALVLGAAAAAAAAPAPGHFAIMPTQIAAAISAAGMQIGSDQVMLLTDVVATTASPRLKVESIVPWGAGRMRARVDCAAREQCLPFYVAIRVVQDTSSRHPMTVLDSPMTVASGAGIDPKSFVVRAGSAATLLLDGAHVHIRIAVVCLENGAPGQTIRVSSKDRRQTYTAKVVDEAVLRASL